VAGQTRAGARLNTKVTNVDSGDRDELCAKRSLGLLAWILDKNLQNVLAGRNIPDVE
jgi:hypothetical protein